MSKYPASKYPATILFYTVASLSTACAKQSCEPTATNATGGEAPQTKTSALFNPLSAPETLTVTSPTFKEGTRIPDASVFGGCGGQNTPPVIEWSGAPEGTKSFAVVAHDPDAPTGVGYFHWLVFNIPTNVQRIGGETATTVPEGATTGHTDFGMTGYGGPCPPPGPDHRYYFTVYALDQERFDLPETTTGATVRFYLRGHTLAYGRIMGTYSMPAQP